MLLDDTVHLNVGGVPTTRSAEIGLHHEVRSFSSSSPRHSRSRRDPLAGCVDRSLRWWQQQRPRQHDENSHVCNDDGDHFASVIADGVAHRKKDPTQSEPPTGPPARASCHEPCDDQQSLLARIAPSPQPRPGS